MIQFLNFKKIVNFHEATTNADYIRYTYETSPFQFCMKGLLVDDFLTIVYVYSSNDCIQQMHILDNSQKIEMKQFYVNEVDYIKLTNQSETEGHALFINKHDT